MKNMKKVGKNAIFFGLGSKWCYDFRVVRATHDCQRHWTCTHRAHRIYHQFRIPPNMTFSESHLIPRIRQVFAALVAVLLVGGLASAPANGALDCHDSNLGMDTMTPARIALLDAAGQRVEINTLIADTPNERASGYQHICPWVIDRTTILFWFGQPLTTRFHMNNVKAALDIGFFDADGNLLEVILMHPYTTRRQILYGPDRPFQYALEARRGFFAARKLVAGRSRLLLDELPR